MTLFVTGVLPLGLETLESLDRQSVESESLECPRSGRLIADCVPDESTKLHMWALNHMLFNRQRSKIKHYISKVKAISQNF